MDYEIGQIVLFPYTFFSGSLSANWLLCNGQQLSIQEYRVLFSVIGNKFGGNGESTFALPDLTHAVPHIKMNYYICISKE
jgi:microcystin-dependent protein